MISGNTAEVAGSRLNLNSSAASGIRSGNKSAVDGEANSMVPAPPIGTTVLPDAAQTPPEFNRENAISGQGSAAPTAGKRTGTQPQIETIIGVLPTAEPFIGHYQYDPVAEAAKEVAANDAAIANLPAGANNLSGVPNDVNSPAGFLKGTGYKDSSGQVIDDITSAAAGSAAGIADAIPQYEGVKGITNNFKAASAHTLTSINNLGSTVNSIKAAVPSVRIPTTTASGQTIIGLQKELNEIEAQLGAFATNANALALDINSQASRFMNDKIRDAKAALGAGASLNSLRDELNKAGINVVADGPGFIFEDSNGNKVVDFSNGIGPVGESLGAISDLTTSYEQVKGAISADLSENQALAVGSFARSIGTEKFLNSNVLRAINSGNTSEVPGLMKTWSYTPVGSDPSTMFGNSAQDGLRSFEGSMYQTPDDVSLDIDLNKTQPGEVTFTQLSGLLDAEREKYTNSIGV
jgi:hypothetical protein